MSGDGTFRGPGGPTVRQEGAINMMVCVCVCVRRHPIYCLLERSQIRGHRLGTVAAQSDTPWTFLTRAGFSTPLAR